VSFDVTLGVDTDLALIVTYDASDGTATLVDNDYTDLPATVTFAAGSSAGAIQTFTVATTGDTKVEADETFDVTVSSADANFDGIDASGTGTITNDDKFGVTVNNSSAAEGTPVSFDVTLGVDTDLALIVTYDPSDGTATVLDNDYTDISGTVTFAAGSSAGAIQTFTVATTGDTKVEPDETFDVTVSSADANFDGIDASGTGTITNNDYRVISVSNPVVVEGGQATFTITLDRPTLPSESVDISYTTNPGSAAAGSDYTTASGIATVTPNKDTVDILVATIDDGAVELPENFTLDLSNVGGPADNVEITANQGTATITDNDNYDISVNDVTVDEGAGMATFTVSLDQAGAVDVSVDYAASDGSATAPADYTAVSGTLPIAAGSTTGTFDVPILEDALVENDETFTVTLSNVVGPGVLADATGTGTITNNDQYSIAIANAPDVVEGNQSSFPVTVSPAIHLGATVTVEYSTSNGTAAAPGDYKYGRLQGNPQQCIK
jgi:hypothetical protein